MEKKILPFTRIATEEGYNNDFNGTVYFTILQFGKNGEDFFTSDKLPRFENQAIKELGSKISINGVKFCDMKGAEANYGHGHAYFYFQVPYKYIYPTKDYPITTLVMEKNTPFYDVILEGVTLYLDNMKWSLIKPEKPQNYRLEPYINFLGTDPYYFVEGDEVPDLLDQLIVLAPYEDIRDDQISVEWQKGAIKSNKLVAGKWTITFTVTDSENRKSVHITHAVVEKKIKVKPFGNKIKVLGHHSDEKVPILNRYIESYLSMESTDIDGLRRSFPYSKNFNKWYVDADNGLIDITRERINKYDVIVPNNNVLHWEEVKGAISYDIILGLDKDFKNVVVDVKNLQQNSYEIENPLIKTPYFYKIKANLKNGKVIESEVFSFSFEGKFRPLKISGVSNVRDLGGFNGSFGTVKQGLIYRGSKFDYIDEKGLHTVKDLLKINSDFDVRCPSRKEINVVNVCELKNGFVFDYINAIYGGLFRKTPEGKFDNADLVKKTFEVFSNKENYPIYFHCSVGRDRTGTIAFVLETLLGADNDRTVQDYLLSQFSVTGAFDKHLYQFAGYRDMLNYGLDNLPGNNNRERLEYFIKECGVTDEELENFRSIMIENYKR